MHVALQCILAENSDEKRRALRPHHLQYMEANKDRIFCGGPTLDLKGQPEMMLIILKVPDLESAQAFIQAEPYNQAGLFKQVIIREWRQVLPASQLGALLRQINH